LLNDLERKVVSHLEDDTHVFPGHDDDTTSAPEGYSRGERGRSSGPERRPLSSMHA
jgi:hypothetical protein